MPDDSSFAVFAVSDILSGVNEVLNTSHGPLSITIWGDRSKNPCVAFHDAGLNHTICFHSLLVASGPSSLLLKNFFIVFIDAPGCQAPDAEVPPEAHPLTLDNLAVQVHEVCQHLNLRECLGLGVGSGGYVLAKCAADHPSLFAGMVLLSPCCRPPGWWEWAAGKAAAAQLRMWGWTGSAKGHLARRLFSSATMQLLGGDSDLMRAFYRDVESVPPAAAAAYLQASLTRKSLLPALPSLQCRVLLVFGADALYQDDCMELAATVNKSRFALVEVDHAGVLLNEERPTELLSPLQLFLTALQLEGIGLGTSLEVGA